MPTMQLERLPEGVSPSRSARSNCADFPGAIDVVSLTGNPTSANVDASDLWTRSPFI